MLFRSDDNWSLTGRLVGNSQAPMNVLANKHVPSWWRLDLGAQYKHTLDNGNVLRARLNIFNVLNREYWMARSTVEESVIMHGPRSVVLSVAYDF